MHRNSQSNDYRNYSYLHRSRSISSRNTHRQFYDSRLHNQQSLHPYTTTTNGFTSSYLQQQQQQYQPLSTISDIPEPVSLFDELGFLRRQRSNVTPFPPVRIPNRRTPGNGTRFATANALRERLLIDIQQNMNEIDHELALLDRRPVIPLYLPIRFASFHQKIAHENRTRSNEPKRAYKVIPRITNQTKKVSSYSTPARTNQNISPSFIGQYHYGPEMEENEIREDDPENTDRNLVVKEIPKLNFYKPLTLDEFRRQQSAFPENRALVSVPEIGGTDQTEVIKKADDFHQNIPNGTDIAEPVPVRTTQEFDSTSKLNFRNFKSLIQNASESTVEIPPPRKPIDNQIFDASRVDLINSMISKPVKHTSSSTNIRTNIERPISPDQPKLFRTFSNDDDTDVNGSYFLNDPANESVNPDALISVYPEKRPLRTESQLITDDIVDNDTKEQQLPKETNPPKNDATKKYVITAVYTLPLSSTT